MGRSPQRMGHPTDRRISTPRRKLHSKKVETTLHGGQVLLSLTEYEVHMEREHPWAVAGDTASWKTLSSYRVRSTDLVSRGRGHSTWDTKSHPRGFPPRRRLNLPELPQSGLVRCQTKLMATLD